MQWSSVRVQGMLRRAAGWPTPGSHASLSRVLLAVGFAGRNPYVTARLKSKPR